MIHSRVLWMLRPVDRSITVSAPQRIAHTIFSTSSSTEEVTAELPILALILVRKLRPMIIGSSSAWLMLAGMMARPRATSSRTNSGRDEGRHRAAELLAVGKGCFGALKLLFAPEVLARGDVDHFLGDDSRARPFELGEGMLANPLPLKGRVPAKRGGGVTFRLHAHPARLASLAALPAKRGGIEEPPATASAYWGNSAPDACR